MPRSRTPTSRRAGTGKPPLGDAELMSLLQKMIKQRQELVLLYEKGGRADLVKQEQEEIAIISGYLPKQMSEAEIGRRHRRRHRGDRRFGHEGHGQGDRRACAGNMPGRWTSAKPARW